MNEKQNENGLRRILALVILFCFHALNNPYYIEKMIDCIIFCLFLLKYLHVGQFCLQFLSLNVFHLNFTKNIN